MSELSDKIEVEYKRIDNGLFPILPGASVNKRYEISHALVYGYHQRSPIPRALGFRSGYDIQQNLHGVNHLINASDVETVVKWLMDHGYEIIYHGKK